MRASWIVLENRFPGLLALGCSSHMVNLTVEDIFKLPEIDILYKQLIYVAKYFKYSYVLLGLLKNAA